jgi:CHAD domain-containing protein
MAKTFGVAMRRTVKRRLARVVRDGMSAVASGNDDDLHALRIEAKRLRYNLEFAAPVLGDAAREPLALLALAQDRLGALADADTFARTYAVMLVDLPATSELRPGLERLCNDAARERVRALEAVRTLWNDPEGNAYLAKLAASISAALGSLSNVEPS